MNEKFEPLNFSLNESKRSERFGDWTWSS